MRKGESVTVEYRPRIGVVTVVGDVEFLPRFLVLGSDRPPVDESVADRITFKSVADSGARLSGLEIRRAVELSDADHVAIVRSSRGVDPNWVLEAARRLRQPRVASVTFVLSLIHISEPTRL